MVYCYSRTSNFPNIPGTQEIKEPLTSDRPLMRFVLAIRAPEVVPNCGLFDKKKFLTGIAQTL